MQERKEPTILNVSPLSSERHSLNRFITAMVKLQNGNYVFLHRDKYASSNDYILAHYSDRFELKKEVNVRIYIDKLGNNLFSIPHKNQIILCCDDLGIVFDANTLEKVNRYDGCIEKTN